MLDDERDILEDGILPEEEAEFDTEEEESY